MRIAFAITSLGGGGAEKVLAWLANNWAEQGHHVSIVTLFGSAGDRHAIHARIERISLGDSGRTSLGRNAGWVVALRRALRSTRPDVVISFLDQVNVLVLLATTGLNVPVIVSERVDPRGGELKPVFRPMRLLLYHRAAAIVVQTEDVHAWFSRRMLGGRTCVIPNPALSPNTAARTEGSPAKRIVSIGRLTHQKGHDLLIKAFAIVASSLPEWELIIYGEGPARAELSRLIATRSLQSRVRLAGRIENVDEALSDAEIFVLASRYEGFPNALLEAMGHGVAVVSFDCPSGPRDLIRHGVDGLLVRPLDVPALANAMKLLSANKVERRVLGARARDVRWRFSEERILEQWRRVIEGVALHQTFGGA